MGCERNYVFIFVDYVHFQISTVDVERENNYLFFDYFDTFFSFWYEILVSVSDCV